jgi:hypothetical protein
MPKGRVEIVEGSLTIQAAQTLDGTLEAENPKIE